MILNDEARLSRAEQGRESLVDRPGTRFSCRSEDPATLPFLGVHAARRHR